MPQLKVTIETNAKKQIYITSKTAPYFILEAEKEVNCKNFMSSPGRENRISEKRLNTKFVIHLSW